MEEQKEKQAVIVELVKEPALDKKGKELKDPTDSNTIFKREDCQGLLWMLSQYDSSKSGSFMKEGRIILKIKDKVEKAWIDDAKSISFTIEEAGTLQKYLNELPAKQVKIPEYVMRTLFGILDALE